MINNVNKIDILCIGETLIDLIGHETNAAIQDTENYERLLGGSPTNVAFNAARLGLTAAIVSTVGNDGLGSFVLEELDKAGVITSYSRKANNKNTSVIMVSRSTGTPDFIAYRDADCYILPEQLPDSLLEEARIYHTTCFALSKKPAQATILEKAARAKELGVQLSIDLNYSEKIWPDTQEALRVIDAYCSNDPLIKLSEDDAYRLFGETKDEGFILNYFHSRGVNTVCLTKGKNGVVLSNMKDGLIRQEALKIENIHDATGAGDAFWTGYLYTCIKEMEPHESIAFAQKLASLKLQNITNWDSIDI